MTFLAPPENHIGERLQITLCRLGDRDLAVAVLVPNWKLCFGSVPVFIIIM